MVYTCLYYDSVHYRYLNGWCFFTCFNSSRYPSGKLNPRIRPRNEGGMIPSETAVGLGSSSLPRLKRWGTSET